MKNKYVSLSNSHVRLTLSDKKWSRFRWNSPSSSLCNMLQIGGISDCVTVSFTLNTTYNAFVEFLTISRLLTYSHLLRNTLWVLSQFEPMWDSPSLVSSKPDDSSWPLQRLRKIPVSIGLEGDFHLINYLNIKRG